MQCWCAINEADSCTNSTGPRLCEFSRLPKQQRGQQFKPDDHSELVPLLPIPNRTVKRLSADDSADSRVKVGHRQATYDELGPRREVGAYASVALL